MRMVNSRDSALESFATCCQLNDPTRLALSALYVRVLSVLKPMSVDDSADVDSMLITLALNSMSHEAIYAHSTAQHR